MGEGDSVGTDELVGTGVGVIVSVPVGVAVSGGVVGVSLTWNISVGIV